MIDDIARKTGLSRYAVIGLLIGLALVLAISLNQCHKKKIITQHETEVKAKVLEKTVEANDKAAERRAQDALNNNKRDEARKDAIENTVDETPSAASVALGCVRLQQAGYDTSRFPSCN